MPESRSDSPNIPAGDARRSRLILGPRAAANEALRCAVDGLRRAGHEVEVRLTWESGDAYRWAREAAEEGIGAVFAAGGDGTVGEVAKGLLASFAGEGAGARRGSGGASGESGGPRRPALGILPFGTANDLASAAGLDLQDPTASLSLLTHGETRTIDLAEAEEHVFVNMATAGFGAEITTQTPTEAKRWLGGFSYLLTGLSRATRLEARPLRIDGPDFSFRGNAFVLAVGNGSQAGGGLRLCPRARLDDGLLDVMVLPEMPLEELLPFVGDAFFSGRFLELRPLIYRQLPWVDIASDQPIQLNLDGEPLRGTEFRIRARPGALRAYLPASELFASG